MIQYVNEIEVKAPVSDVFAKLTSPAHISEWFPGLDSFSYEKGVNAKDPGMAHFKMKMDMHHHSSSSHHSRYKTYNGRVTAFFKDREFGIEFGEAEFTNRMIFRVQGSGSESTRVQVEVHLSFNTPFAEKMANFFSWIGRAKVKNTLRGLKLRCETDEVIKEGKALKLSPQVLAVFFFLDLLVVGAILWFYLGGGQEVLGL